MRQVFFTNNAVRQFKRLPRGVRPFIKEAIQIHLIEEDPTERARNKFRLRRPSEYADYELRAGNWRVFYRVDQQQVTITCSEKKRATV